MNKILLIGSTGQVGQELLKALQPIGELVNLTRKQLDLTQPEIIQETITALKPKVIVNASAYTAVDKAETDAEIAMKVNALAPKIMAQAAQKNGTKLLHISTDYVFDGQNSTPYSEEDRTNPLGVYGQSKLLGEKGILENCDRYLILRTAWVYGSRGHGNFVKTMLRLGAERAELKVVADQIGSPSGIYHFASSGVASWYDFAVAIFEEAAKIGFPLKIKKVLPITTADYPTPAQRPNYSVLSKGKYTKAVGVYPPYWRDSLRKMLAELQRKEG
jgi:dTDP-4-dehydrorhamnose reductase